MRGLPKVEGYSEDSTPMLTLKPAPQLLRNTVPITIPSQMIWNTAGEGRFDDKVSDKMFFHRLVIQEDSSQSGVGDGEWERKTEGWALRLMQCPAHASPGCGCRSPLPAVTAAASPCR